MKREPNVSGVVAAGLCTTCGVCAGVCPAGVIRLEEDRAGLLLPRLVEADCTHCGICHESCPGWRVTGDPGSLSSNPFAGPILAAYTGYAADPAIRRGGQSGGVVTALLLFALERGWIDSAVVTGLHLNGTVRARGRLATTREEILSTQGSKYCPSGTAAAAGALLAEERRAAVVGLACQLHGMANAAAKLPKLDRRVVFRLGLFCEHILSAHAIDYFHRRAGMDPARATDFAFKRKGLVGWPGDLFFADRSGREKYVSRTVRMEAKDLFTPARCRLCFDKLNVTADLAVGDPWGLATTKEGSNSLLVRTERGRQWLDAAREAGAVVLEPEDPYRVLMGQKIREQRRQTGAYNTLWRRAGLQAPDFGPALRPYLDYTGPVPGRYRRGLRWSLRLGRPGQRLLVRLLPASMPIIRLRLGGWVEAVFEPTLKKAKALARRLLRR